MLTAMTEDFMQPKLEYPLERSLNWRAVSRLFHISGALIQKMLLSSYSFSIFLPGMEMKYTGLTFFLLLQGIQSSDASFFIAPL